MRIFLIGMMGSGKTTLGRQLAQRIGYTFVDLDEYIVRQQGQSIAQIFERQGQEHFRKLERQALEEVVQQYEQAVVSTGGGAPCFFNNIDFINLHGESFYLKVPVEQLLQRLLDQGQAERPLLAGKSPAELKVYLTETLAHRKQFYERAKHTLAEASPTTESFLRLLNL
ncbi:shikimate kinase [Pontibacter anaerobius]|uniref:Shikimate kinase n=1 Tax=Pontibacter anaerobius TaxID=2993940 RepID=A0ABT3RL14_9BACT|nr:shikimate kinase [Pontibacter anaerobius]MCX2741982.1 shikimate kinase [Pontibacter anaerobius]